MTHSGDPKLCALRPAGDADWRVRLRDAVADSRTPLHLAGVGNELRSDDAVGLEIVASLRSRLGAVPGAGVKIHRESAMPERLLAKLASEEGKIVVFDASEASVSPGGVVFRSMADTKYGFFGTHNIPLRLVPGLSNREGEVFLVGVQPASLEVGEGLSEVVSASARQIVDVVVGGVEGRS